MNAQLPHLVAQLVEQLSQQVARDVAELLEEQLASAPANASPWLSTDRAAEYLDWPRQRLYKLAAQGAIPHYKHGNRLLFHRTEIDNWLRQHAHGARA